MDMHPNGYYYLMEIIPGSHALPTAQVQHPEGVVILIEMAMEYLNVDWPWSGSVWVWALFS